MTEAFDKIKAGLDDAIQYALAERVAELLDETPPPAGRSWHQIALEIAELFPDHDFEAVKQAVIDAGH